MHLCYPPYGTMQIRSGDLWYHYICNKTWYRHTFQFYGSVGPLECIFMALLALSNAVAPTHFFHLMETPTMRLPNVKVLLCWSSRTQIYGFVENHTFWSNLLAWGYQHNLLEWGYQHNFPIWGYQHNLLEWGTSTIFSTLHGSLWLGKDKGSIMKSAESGSTIL